MILRTQLPKYQLQFMSRKLLMNVYLQLSGNTPNLNLNLPNPNTNEEHERLKSVLRTEMAKQTNKIDADVIRDAMEVHSFIKLKCKRKIKLLCKSYGLKVEIHHSLHVYIQWVSSYSNSDKAYSRENPICPRVATFLPIYTQC